MSIEPHKITIGMMVNEISKLFFDKTRRECERQGINVAYQKMLFHIAHNDGLTQSELTRLVHHKPSSVSVILQKMENDGLIIRKQDPDDMRSVRIFMTEKGLELDVVIRKIFIKTEHEITEGISQEEHKTVISILEKVRANALGEDEK